MPHCSTGGWLRLVNLVGDSVVLPWLFVFSSVEVSLVWCCRRHYTCSCQCQVMEFEFDMSKPVNSDLPGFINK